MNTTMKTMMVLAIAAGAALCARAVPTAFSYQGRLMNADGTAPLSGNQKVEIRLYDTPTAGAALWGRMYSVLLDATGLFNAELSDSTGSALNGAPNAPLEQVVADNAATTLYVGLTVVGSSGEISPRQKLLAVPYATFASDVARAKRDFTVSGTLTAKSLAVSNALTAASVSVSGAVGGATLETSGNTTVKGNLTVNGEIKGKGMVPVGTIIMWSGSLSELSSEWALCDGNNGTPNLCGRFIVGAGGSYAIGDKGGEEKHKLTVDEIPSHQHNNSVKTVGYGASHNGSAEAATFDGYSRNNGWRDISGASKGGDQPHENRPPYYALAFVMRIK